VAVNNRNMDEMDWIIKYFIILSIVLSVLFSFWLIFLLEQKDSVFISKKIQIKIQEVIFMQSKYLENIIIIMMIV
jgi:hypothetical protein